MNAVFAGKIGVRVAIVTTVAIATLAAFLFGTSASGYTFATGGFNLKIDSHAVYNGVLQPQLTWGLKNLNPHTDKFFNFDDVKPGDRGTTTISLHVNKDAWICLDFETLKQKENGINRPESLVDNTPNAGELAAGTEFFAWYDNGNNIFEIGETPIFGTTTGKQAATQVLNQMTYALADSKTGNPIPGNKTRYIGVTWCAGDLEVDLATAQITCNGAVLGNEAQTDSFTFDVSLRAVPSKDNKHFTCVKPGTTCVWPGCDGTNCGGSVNVNVTNNATVINHTTSSANTGGNSAGPGGTVITGNASASSVTTNVVNTTIVNVHGAAASATNILNNLLLRLR